MFSYLNSLSNSKQNEKKNLKSVDDKADHPKYRKPVLTVYQITYSVLQVSCSITAKVPVQ